MKTSRRQFSKTFFAGASALAFAPQTIACIANKPKENLGVALVGLGYYSTDLLAPALQQTKYCHLAGIVTGTPEKAERWKRQYKIADKNIYDYTTFDRMADNPDIDVIYIVLPPSMHAEYAIRAANAGKHVWCEKPMAVTVAECDAMIAACAKNKVTLAIGYRMQHEPNTREIMRMVREKTFGKTRLVSTAAGYFDGRTHHWKQQKNMGGGAMYDMGVYALQGARYSVGEEPVAVMAQRFTNRPDIYKEVDETTLFQLEFPSGAVANCATSFGMNMNYLYATCEQGSFKLEPFQSYSGIQGSASNGTLLNKSVPNQQAKQMDDDALAIMQGKPLMVPGEEGRRDIRVVEAIHRSALEGRRVVL